MVYVLSTGCVLACGYEIVVMLDLLFMVKFGFFDDLWCSLFRLVVGDFERVFFGLCSG
jgi:hypothetical protein